MWLWVIIGVILIITGYLLFAPIVLDIDTTINLYRLRFHRLAFVSIQQTENTVALNIQVAWWSKTMDLVSIFLKEKKQRSSKKKKTGKHKKAKQFFKKWMRKGIRVLKTFRLLKCIIILDTGDVILNGWLYPVFYMLHYKTGKMIAISFTENDKIILQIRNSLARILWALIQR